MRIIILIGLCLFVLACLDKNVKQFTNIQPIQDRSEAFEFNKRMGRGMNFQDYQIDGSSKCLGGYHHSYDFQIIREHHFTHVRIGGRLYEYVSNDGTIYPFKLTSYKKAVDWALAENLMVIMDPIHWWQTYTGSDRPKLVKLWKQIATEFADYSIDMVAFEIMNEPHRGTEAPKSASIDLELLISESLEAIRSVSGNESRIVFIAGDGFPTDDAVVEAFKNNRFPIYDPYLIVTPHFYKPKGGVHPFTNQDEENPQYWGESGDSDPDWSNLSAEFDKVVTANENWASANNTIPLPVYLGEYGVVNAAPNADRKRWLWWTRMEAEKRGWSTGAWTLYNDAPHMRGYGPWTTVEQNDPYARHLQEDVIKAIYTRYEAENAALVNGGIVFDNNHPGSSGPGYVDLSNASSEDNMRVDSVYIARSGTYDMTIRYSNSSSDPVILKIGIYDRNGHLVDEKNSVSFPSTSSSDLWQTLTVPFLCPTDTATSVNFTVLQNPTCLSLDYICITNGVYYDNLFP